MADLSPFDDAAGSTDRGQIILVAGFVLAVTLVALALVMNSAIYTGNLATRPESSGATDALSFRTASEATTADLLRHANDVHAGDRSAAEDSVAEGIEAYGRLSGRQAAFDAHATNVSYAGSRDGVRVHQASTSELTDASGAGNWSLGDGVENTRAFRIRVDSVSSGRDFELNATTGTDEWRMNVTSSGMVGIRRDSGAEDVCWASGGAPFWINVSAGTVDGNHCDGLDFTEGNDDTDYEIWFSNASQVEGEYALVHDGSAPSSSDFSGATDEPTANEVLYAVEADLLYRTSELRYETTIRVAPGESDG